MHTTNYDFLMKPKESARCHQTLSSRVGSGDETNIVRSSCVHMNYDSRDALVMLYTRDYVNVNKLLITSYYTFQDAQVRQA